MAETEESIPWIEKYRPKQFDNIVLEPLNRRLFRNILAKNYFPNLLFYGPPGTGKTTTIINLIQEYQTKYSRPNKSNVIHLNASDERGIDIIRNQIYSFVRSMNLFEQGLKFVILDEVDYMTKNAQQALKCLIQTTTNINANVRIILICNYISKIDEALQNEFICVRFNQLPKHEIHDFIQNIAKKENIQISRDAIDTIQTIYQSDVRSMINYLQVNQHFRAEEWRCNVISSAVLEELHRIICRESPILDFVSKISVQYNIDKRHILYHYFNFIIRHFPELTTPSFLEIVKECVHTKDIPIEDLLEYCAVQLCAIYR